MDGDFLSAAQLGQIDINASTALDFSRWTTPALGRGESSGTISTASWSTPDCSPFMGGLHTHSYAFPCISNISDMMIDPPAASQLNGSSNLEESLQELIVSFLYHHHHHHY
jgi:hypothetical protein